MLVCMYLVVIYATICIHFKGFLPGILRAFLNKTRHWQNDYSQYITLFLTRDPHGFILLFLHLLQVQRYNHTGMYDDARIASKYAGLYAKIGIVIGSICLAVGLILTVIAIIVYAAVAYP